MSLFLQKKVLCGEWKLLLPCDLLVVNSNHDGGAKASLSSHWLVLGPKCHRVRSSTLPLVPGAAPIAGLSTLTFMTLQPWHRWEGESSRQ